MHPRQFRLLEIHQRIDEALRRELQRRWPDRFIVLRLNSLKSRVKDRLRAMVRQPQSSSLMEFAR